MSFHLLLRPEEIQEQAEKLLEYQMKGGSKTAWLRSKDFHPLDRGLILAAASELLLSRADSSQERTSGA